MNDLAAKTFFFLALEVEVKLLCFPRAHWYLAVICFPGLEGPLLEKNPVYLEQPAEESIPEHCRPLSPDGLDCSPEEADVDPGGSQDEREQHYSSKCSGCFFPRLQQE